MRQFLRSIFIPAYQRDAADVRRIHTLRAEFTKLTDAELTTIAVERTLNLLQIIALTAVIASRVLGQEMHDQQLLGSLAMARGSIAEMQTGEGKTLSAVPAVAWYALQKNGIHVMTANDYLARRDAQWMGEIYRRLGLSCVCVQQGMTPDERRAAYQQDITYATAQEIGFDFLRDQLALDPGEQVHRAFAAALIDEADSILIDDARVPLVIAGGGADDESQAIHVDAVVRGLRRGLHYTVDIGAHNVALTDAGIQAVESALRSGSLFDEGNLPLVTAVQEALHVHALLRRDVDYVVKNNAIEAVDAERGRIAQDRRWPAGLQTALEAKEGVAAKRQGRILGSITLQHLVALYPQVCGMTGTAATQALELRKVYGLPVEVIPTHLPIIRTDHPDALFATRAEKEQAIVAEIRRIHATGQPLLVGTGSVEESESLSELLYDVPHRVLNARQDAEEAGIIAQAGERGAVTISTNMAGRGTDIRLGPGVVELGGLYVLGTCKHESRRLDNQLRGRAGRQGDPGVSRFFVSLQDELLVKYADLDPEEGDQLETVQRLVEGRHLDQRIFLHGYEVPIEGQRHQFQSYRQKILTGVIPCESEQERLVTLRAIDDAWADYLGRVMELRSGVQWLSWGRRDPHHEYLKQIHDWFGELQSSLPEAIAQRLEAGGPDPRERGAVWTYLTTDQPFGTWTERLLKGLKRKKRWL